MSSRRSFFQQFLLGAVPLVVPGFFFSPNDPAVITLFIDESGYGSPSVLGVLRSSASFDIESNIEALRKKYNYKKELSYHSTDKYKLSFSKDLIDYFFAEPSLTFHARFISEKVDPSNEQVASIEDKIYQVNLRKIIGDATGSAKSLSLITKQRRSRHYNAYDNSQINDLNTYLQENLNLSTRLKFIESKGNNLYQLADLFTGSIFGDQISVGNPTKIEILNYLKKKLSVKELSDVYNKPEQRKFVIKKPNS